MVPPKFFVIARVVGRDGAIALWKERLIHLCGVSATEPYGDSYYWGADLDGEPDTLWGLEGYTHPIGFFIDHVSSEIFKREMGLVDKDELLRHKQGLGSPDYDLHHYDQEAGWLKRDDDPDRDSKTSYVAVHHFWTSEEAERSRLLDALGAFAEETRGGEVKGVQSCLVLRECRDLKMASLWLRTKTEQDYQSFQQRSLASLLEKVKPLISKTEVHLSQSFDGHLNLKGE